jgi:hypothetical protein
MSSDRGVSRRRILSAVGVGTAATLAGCTGRTVAALEGRAGTGDLSLLMMSAPNEAVIGKPHSITAKIRNVGRRPVDLRTAFERRAPGREWTRLETIERTVPAGDTITVVQEVVFDEQLTTWTYRLTGFGVTVAVGSRLDCGCKREGQPLLDDESEDEDGEESDESKSGAGRVSGPNGHEPSSRRKGQLATRPGGTNR